MDSHTTIPTHDCGALALLLVDDEATFRTSLAEMLRDDGHVVLDYAAPAALPELDSLRDIGVLVTDYEMPGQNGLELADAFHASHPDVPVIVLTGYRVGTLAAEIAARSFTRLAEKPVDYAALHELIHEATRSRHDSRSQREERVAKWA
jgi:DNA-binding NtrC family response regulator